MNIIKVKDFDSMQAITVGLARNGYMVTADSVTDENYKDHWEIKYCEFSEINKIPVNNGGDWDGDYLGSIEIHNKDNTKGVKCEFLPDEKPVTPDDEETGDDTDSTNDEKPSEENNDNDPDIPNFKPKDASDNITDEQMTAITSVSGN